MKRSPMPPRKTGLKATTIKAIGRRPKMTPARKAAKGQECMVRLPGICNGNPETTVLAHYRLANYCGGGMKPDDDAFGAWACSACHDEVDGRTRSHAYTHDELRLMHAEGCLRTIAARGLACAS